MFSAVYNPQFDTAFSALESFFLKLWQWLEVLPFGGSTMLATLGIGFVMFKLYSMFKVGDISGG